MKFIYLACPYSQPDQALNVYKAIQAADILQAAGYIPYIPILNHLWQLISPKSYETWLEMDLQWIQKCDALLRLPGDSPGADREVRFAEHLGIPVYYSIEELRQD